MVYKRDPVSVAFDASAARLLRRAHANQGKWVGTYIQNPGLGWELAARRGNLARLLGPDTAPGGEARTRWMRGFVRSLYYIHKHHYWESRGVDLSEWRLSPNWAGTLRYETGNVRIRERADGVLFIGRYIRIQLAGKTSKPVPEDRKWKDKGPRWSDPATRNQ
jgi:hypothetical protein